MTLRLAPVVVKTFFDYFCGHHAEDVRDNIFCALGERWEDILNTMERVETAANLPRNFFHHVRDSNERQPPTHLKAMGQNLFEAARKNLSNNKAKRAFLIALWLCVSPVLDMIRANKEIVREIALYVAKHDLRQPEEGENRQNSPLELKLAANMKEVTTLNVLLVGRSKVAKSALAIALFGASEGTPTDNSYVTCFSRKFQGRKVDLYVSDIPIYEAVGKQGQRGAERLLNEVDEYAEEIDLLVVCQEMGTISSHDQMVLRALGSVFEDVWTHCVVALVNAAGNDRTTEVLRILKMKYSDFLEHAASEISYVPAGNQKRDSIPGIADWITEFWITAAAKATAKAANFLLAHNLRCGRINSHVNNAIILKQDHYERIQAVINKTVTIPLATKRPKKKLSKKKKAAIIGGSAVAGGAAGAAAGAILGPLGAAVGGFLGSAGGALAGGIGLIVKKKLDSDSDSD